MPIPFVDQVDLNLIPLKNFVVEPLAADPSATPGRLYKATATGFLKYYNEVTGTWRFLDAAGITDGTINISGIKNFDSTIRGYRLDQFAAPTNPVNGGGQEFQNILAAASSTSATRLDQVQQLIAQGVAGVKAIKDPVRAQLTTPVTTTGNLTGIPTAANADGVTLVDGDEIFNPDTAANTQGKWVVHSGAWTRPIDWANGQAVEEGTQFVVMEGTANNGAIIRVTNTAQVLTIGTTVLTFQTVAKAVAYQADNNTTTLSSNTFSVKIDGAGWLTSSASGLAIDKTKVAGKSAPYTITGDGATKQFTVNHGLTLQANQTPQISMMDASGNVVNAGFTVPNTTSVAVNFAIAPASGVKYYVSIVG